MNKSYVFITGCPRSGTSALQRLLESHPQILIGRERFSKQLLAGELSPELFSPEGFVKDYPKVLRKSELSDTEVLERYQTATYVGDKLPYLYMQFERLGLLFPHAKILFIFRNIFDVAASFKARANNADDLTWAPELGVEAALENWAFAVNTAFHTPSSLNVAYLCYESLFYQTGSIDAVFEFLHLDVPKVVREKFEELRHRATNLEKNRKTKTLSTEEVFLISREAPFDKYRDILKHVIC